jgi:hypothetical protein
LSAFIEHLTDDFNTNSQNKQPKENLSMKTQKLSFLIALVAATFAVVGCGPDNGSSNPGNNNYEPDAYVFPDARPRPDAAECEDTCTANDTQCVTGGFQVCGNFDADSCMEWGPIVACDEGEKCVNGSCQAACTDDCTEGSVRCDPDSAVEGTQTCEEGRDGCWHWSATVECNTEETCSGGVCSSECSHECADGSRQCSGDGYQVCGDFDTDECFEWGPITDCATGETCSNGYCDTSCSSECTAGSTRCDGSDGYQECGDFDSDSCLEWGPKVLCNTGETCSNGVCSTTCQDECDTEGDVQCTASEDGYQVCSTDHDIDACFEWGPVITCNQGEICQNGQCVAPCDCDFYPGICEPDAPNSTTPCPCDPDCGTPCGADGHCDTWCPSGDDPDCSCVCDYNEYCEADAPDSDVTCSCDPDCEPHEYACSDDGHCDTFCPAGVDPDCGGVDPCRDRWLSVGWRWADELWLYDSYEQPDPDEGGYWVLLSPNFSSGTGELFVELAAEHIACVDNMRVEVWGYDDSVFGDGAEIYLYNWNTYSFDLLPDETVGDTEGVYTNYVTDVLPYIWCGTDKCFIDAKVTGSAWDNTHVWWMEVFVHMAP